MMSNDIKLLSIGDIIIHKRFRDWKYKVLILNIKDQYIQIEDCADNHSKGYISNKMFKADYTLSANSLLKKL